MKRILSFVLVCFMIMSTLVVMNVGAEETKTYTMPIDWSTGNVEQYKGWDIAKQGEWSFKSFTDLSDISTAISNENVVAYDEMTSFNNTQTPFPYVGANRNEQKAQNNPGVSKYDILQWYVNHDKRWNGIMFAGNTTDAIAFCADNEQKGAILFTAPEAGTYSFTETVAVMLDQLNDGTPLTYEITIRKNGTVLDTFVPTDKNAKTLTGTVELAAGDLLMFCFEQTSHQTLTSTNAGANDPKCVSISNVKVTKTGAATDDGNGDNTGEGGEDNEEEITVTVGQKFTSDLAIGKSVSGQFFMAGYKVADGTLVPVEPDERETWDPAWPGHFVAEANTIALFCKPETSGAFDMNTKLDYNSAVAFKAPAKATYAIDVKVARLYALSDPDRPVNIILMKDDGTVIDKVENVQGANTEVVFDKSVALEKDEVVFVRVQFAGTEEACASGGFNVRLESFEVTVESVGSAGDDNTGDNTTTNPDTSDNLVLAVSALMLAAAGVVIASKKRR